MRGTPAILAVLLAAGCGSSTPAAPASAPASDGGVTPQSTDGGATPDAGTAPDSGPPTDDGGVPPGDAGTTDGGTTVDDGGTGTADGGTTSADGGTSTDGGTTDGGTTADGGTTTADGGTTASCPSGYAPGPGLVVTANSGGSCANLAPRAPTCEAAVAACAGVTNTSQAGPQGNFSVRGSSDGDGMVALFCANVDLGPDPGFNIWSFDGLAWRRTTHLGDAVWPQLEGFVALSTTYPAGRPPAFYDFFDGAGSKQGSVPTGDGYPKMLASPFGRVALRLVPVAGGNQITATAYSASGAQLGSNVLGTSTQQYPFLGGAVDVAGTTLAIFGDHGASALHARWIASDGMPASAPFEIARSAEVAGVGLALPDGGVALGSPITGTWVWSAVIASGKTTVEAPPSWLDGRGQPLGFVRAARGLAFVTADDQGVQTVEIVAADGTSCGKISGPKGMAFTLGGDGTLFLADRAKTFRFFPALLR